MHAAGVTLLQAECGCVLKHKLSVHNIEGTRSCCAEMDTLLTRHFDPQLAHQCQQPAVALADVLTVDPSNTQPLVLAWTLHISREHLLGPRSVPCLMHNSQSLRLCQRFLTALPTRLLAPGQPIHQQTSQFTKVVGGNTARHSDSHTKHDMHMACGILKCGLQRQTDGQNLRMPSGQSQRTCAYHRNTTLQTA